jgi:hypothetical protein
MKKLLLTGLLFASVFVLPIQADFIQCPGFVECFGSDNADVINGSPVNDGIGGLLGNDIIFGNDGRDGLTGGAGNDVLFGGLGSDSLSGSEGNDTLIPGPDDAGAEQDSNGGAGNDTIIVLVGETVLCQTIRGREDFDVLHLIGFGPYIAEFPYGAPEPITLFSHIVIQDPIAGGYILVEVTDANANRSIERINGLASPNVTVIDFAALQAFLAQNCSGSIT